MRSVTFFVVSALVLAFSTIANAALSSNLSNNFRWDSAGSYTGSGRFQTLFAYPANTPMTEVDGFLYVDTDRHVISIQTPSATQASQWVNDDGYWLQLPNGTCLKNPAINYTTYILDYTELKNTDITTTCNSESLPNLCIKNKHNNGLARDPGACDTYVYAGVKTKRHVRNNLDGENSQNDIVYTVETYNIDQVVYIPEYNIVSKYFGSLHINNTVFGQPDIAKVQLPASCSTAGLYCSVYYPPGKNYTLAR
jgi:hypothetical protein